MVRHKNNLGSVSSSGFLGWVLPSTIPNLSIRALKLRSPASGTRYTTFLFSGMVNRPRKGSPVVRAFASERQNQVFPDPLRAPKNEMPSGRKSVASHFIGSVDI